MGDGGSVALVIKRWDFPGTALYRSNWTHHSCQRRKLAAERHGLRAFDCELALADHVYQSDAASTEPADRNDSKLSIGLVIRLMARWSCSTMLLRYLTWRTKIRTSRPALIASMAAVLAPLLSIATLSGSPFPLALSKKCSVAAMSRFAVSRKSTVLPRLSTAR
jgi:hypothetical protein